MAQAKKVDPKIAHSLKAWRERGGPSRLELARSLGVGKTTVSNWELGLNEPSLEMLVKIAEVADEVARQAFLSAAGRKTRISSDNLEEVSAAQTARQPVALKTTSALIPVPVVAIKAGAGPGRLNDAEYVIDQLQVPKSFGFSGDLACITVDGDSMEPTISSGAPVIIESVFDIPERYINKIVAAWHETDGVVIKRLVRREGVLRLASDNTGYMPLDFADGWTISGIVRWWFQSAEGR